MVIGRDMPSKIPKHAPPKRPKRNFAAQGAKNQKAGPMKDRRTERAGAKNPMRELIRLAEE
jgi:hypothetical protein